MRFATEEQQKRVAVLSTVAHTRTLYLGDQGLVVHSSAPVRNEKKMGRLCTYVVLSLPWCREASRVESKLAWMTKFFNVFD